MLILAQGHLNPELVQQITAFRDEVYLRDRVVIDSTVDWESWHIVLVREGGIDACIRYERHPEGLARIGGWAIRDSRRGSRDAVKLVLRCVQLAEELGDVRGIATATTRHHSAEILERLGGEVMHRYFDPRYGCEMVSIQFWLSDMRHRIPKAA